MAQNSVPSRSGADSGSLAGTFQMVLRKTLEKTDGQLPAKVIAYDRTRNLATVQPIIAVVTKTGNVVSRAQIAAVPVLALGGGGFVLSFPIKKDDLGWIQASDRDISLYLNSLAEATPNTRRIHSFEDGLFIPDIMKNYTIDEEDAANVVLQSTDGTVRLSLSADTAKITAPNVNIEATDVEITSTTLTHNGVNIGSTHVHGGVTPGGSNTGTPT